MDKRKEGKKTGRERRRVKEERTVVNEARKVLGKRGRSVCVCV